MADRVYIDPPHLNIDEILRAKALYWSEAHRKPVTKSHTFKKYLRSLTEPRRYL